MVAHHLRASAITMVVLLLATTFLAVAPSTTAQTVSTDQLNELKVDGGTPPAEIRPGMVVLFRVRVAIPDNDQACQTGGSAPTGSVWQIIGADMDLRPLGGPAAFANTTFSPTTSRNVLVEFTHTVATATVDAANAHGTRTLPITIKALCPVPPGSLPPPAVSDRTTTPIVHSVSFTYDASPPALTSGTAALAHDSTQRVHRGTEPVGDATVASIGTTVTIAPDIGDATRIEWNLEDFITGATWTDITSLSLADRKFNVEAAGTDGWKSLDNVTGVVRLRATDAAGNAATDLTTLTVKVDNVRPSTETAFSVRPSLMTRSATEATLRTGFTGDVSVPFAERQVSYPGGTASTALVFAGEDTTLPLTGIASPLTSVVTTWFVPIDGAGNPNRADDAREGPAFPDGITVRYGPDPNVATPTVIAGTAFGDVTVTVGSNGPTIDTTTTPQDLKVYGRLIRKSGADVTYWKLGTSGADPAADFTATDQVDPEGGTPTRFTVPIPTAGSTTSPFTLSNLANRAAPDARAFAGGSYELSLNVQSPTGHRTQLGYPIAIDSDAPMFLAQSNAGAIAKPTGLGYGPNMSADHGQDGNPLQVFVRVADERKHTASGSYTDTGLKNITVQLVSLDLATVIKSFEFNPSTCGLNTAADFGYCVRIPGEDPAGPDCTADKNNDRSDARCRWARYTHADQLLDWTLVAFAKSGTDLYARPVHFSGWFNTTVPDLPAGTYRVRVLATDFGGKISAVLAGTSSADLYKVLPAASVRNPLVTADGHFEAVPLGSQRFAAAPSGRVCDTAGTTCAADAVRIYVSNSPTGASRSLYATYSSIAARNEPETVGVAGFSANEVIALNGTLKYTPATSSAAPTLTMFPYTTGQTSQQPLLSSLDPAINASMDVYVQIESVRLAADGTDLVVGKSPWIRSASALAPALSIKQPPTEWGLNLSTEFTSTKTGPGVNVTFDRKTSTVIPKLTWDLATYGATALTQVASGNIATPEGSFTTPRSIFNWTWTLHGATSSTPLGVGEYQLRVRVHDGDVDLPIAQSYRNFSVLEKRPNLTLLDGAIRVGAAQRSGDLYVKPTFEVPFSVNQSFANLTSVDQLEFRLVRAVVTAGQARELKVGDEGFAVSVIPEALDASLLRTNFTAFVTLPPGAADGAVFQLNITAKLDMPPYRVGNASAFLTLRIDKVPPAGATLVPETKASVRDSYTNPAHVNRTPEPTIRVFAEDRGSGIQKVEVRIVDITTSETLRLAGSTLTIEPGTDGSWLDNTTAGALMVKRSADAADVQVWDIPLKQFWHDDQRTSSAAINLSHRYRVDVRATDRLGQTPATWNSTHFDFDGAAPYLGYGGSRLNTTGNVRSGIIADAHQIGWHAAGTLRVNVTDDHCIAAVRLKGVSERAPSVVQTALMMPIGYASTPSRVCYNTMPHNTTASPTAGPANLKFVQYELNLINAPQLTDLVGNYTYWFEAEDETGKVSEVPSNFRTFRMNVLDNAPAVVRSVNLDPSPGQAGGRAVVRADVFDNLQVSHVDVTFHDINTFQVLKTARMRPVTDNVTAEGNGIYVADTETDLGLTLEVRDYLVNVTAYDVNWNRTVANGGPTCTSQRCTPFPPMIYRVRDDGEPAVVLESPAAGSTVNGTPTFTLRALHKNLGAAGVTIVAGMEGEEAIIPQSEYNLTALTSANGTAQGFTIRYSPTNITDGGNFTLNVSAHVSGLTNATSFTFRVDAEPPTVAANVTGKRTIGDKDWATEDTRVRLTAEDNVSAVTTFYSVNGGAALTYATPITPAGAEGEWKLEYWATDAAGNSAPRASLTLELDTSGPRISISKHGDELLLTVTDAGVGLNESTITVHYRYGDAIAFTTKIAEKVAGNGYTAILPGNATATGLAYYVTALDGLGNAGSNYTATQPYIIPKPGTGEDPVDPTPVNNFPPTITITQPATGAGVRGTLDLKWLAEDPEGEPLTITIALRDPAPGRVLVTAGENSGSYKVDLAGQSAGAYTIVVTASDGEHSESAQVTFNVESGETIQIRNAPPATVQLNGQVSVAVAISPVGKSVTQANYRIVKDGQLYSAGRLTSAENQFATTFSPTESGAYRVLVDVQYSDGTTETSKQVASFSVPNDGSSGTTRNFPVSLMVLAAVGVLTIALAGYGAFGRWRK